MKVHAHYKLEHGIQNKCTGAIYQFLWNIRNSNGSQTKSGPFTWRTDQVSQEHGSTFKSTPSESNIKWIH